MDYTRITVIVEQKLTDFELDQVRDIVLAAMALAGVSGSVGSEIVSEAELAEEVKS